MLSFEQWRLIEGVNRENRPVRLLRESLSLRDSPIGVFVHIRGASPPLFP